MADRINTRGRAHIDVRPWCKPTEAVHVVNAALSFAAWAYLMLIASINFN